MNSEINQTIYELKSLADLGNDYSYNYNTKKNLLHFKIRRLIFNRRLNLDIYINFNTRKVTITLEDSVTHVYITLATFKFINFEKIKNTLEKLTKKKI